MKMGRKVFVPSGEQRKNVETLAGLGIRHEDICLLVICPKTKKPIDDKTLRKHFRAELSTGVVKANAKASQCLLANVEAGNVTAQIWWTKARMGWSEKIEHGGNLSLSISKTDAAL